MGTAALPAWAAVDAAIAAGSGAALSFLDRLIAEPSTVGQEQAAHAEAADRAIGRWPGSSPGSSRVAACRRPVIRAMVIRP